MADQLYPKINAPFKRDQTGKILLGDWCMPELEYLRNNEWEFTEKVDGMCITLDIEVKDGVINASIYGKTLRSQIPEGLQRWFDSWNGRKYDGDFEGNMRVFGEGYGAKIQNGGNYRADQGLAVFDVNIGGFWLSRENVEDVALKAGLPVVPVVGYGTLDDAFRLVARGQNSQWGDFRAEGVIAKPRVPMYTRQGSRIITKIKWVDFVDFDPGA